MSPTTAPAGRATPARATPARGALAAFAAALHCFVDGHRWALAFCRSSFEPDPDPSGLQPGRVRTVTVAGYRCLRCALESTHREAEPARERRPWRDGEPFGWGE